MNEQDLLRLLYKRMDWHNGASQREQKLLQTIKFFRQNIIVSGKEKCGKTSTVLTGIAYDYLSKQMSNRENAMFFGQNTNDKNEATEKNSGSDVNLNEATNCEIKSENVMSAVVKVAGNNYAGNNANMKNEAEKVKIRPDDNGCCDQTNESLEKEDEKSVTTPDSRIAGKAFAVILCYKTSNCEDMATALNFLLPECKILVLTSSVNWATVFDDLKIADVILITFDHLDFFYMYDDAVHYPKLRFFVVDEAITMCSSNHMHIVEYFLKRFVNRNGVQVIIISRVITADHIKVYKQLTGVHYTRCEMSDEPQPSAAIASALPKLFRTEFRG